MAAAILEKNQRTFTIQSPNPEPSFRPQLADFGCKLTLRHINRHPGFSDCTIPRLVTAASKDSDLCREGQAPNISAMQTQVLRDDRAGIVIAYIQPRSEAAQAGVPPSGTPTEAKRGERTANVRLEQGWGLEPHNVFAPSSRSQNLHCAPKQAAHRASECALASRMPSTLPSASAVARKPANRRCRQSLFRPGRNGLHTHR
jgi:hypothetical protein